jgi:hypothetical protein
MNSTPDIRLTPVDESIFKTISAGKFASREVYRLRLWAEHAQLVSGFDELICLDQLSLRRSIIKPCGTDHAAAFPRTWDVLRRSRFG